MVYPYDQRLIPAAWLLRIGLWLTAVLVCPHFRQLWLWAQEEVQRQTGWQGLSHLFSFTGTLLYCRVGPVKSLPQILCICINSFSRLLLSVVKQTTLHSLDLHRCESFGQFCNKRSIASSLLQGARPIECIGLSSKAGNQVNKLGLLVPLS